MRRLVLNRLKLKARVGILPHELDAAQPLEVWITAELPDAPLQPQHDDIRHVFDYCHLRDAAIEEAGRGHVNMLETLAGRIAKRLLGYKPVSRVVVRIEKPSIFDDCDAIGIEVSASKT